MPKKRTRPVSPRSSRPATFMSHVLMGFWHGWLVTVFVVSTLVAALAGFNFVLRAEWDYERNVALLAAVSVSALSGYVMWIELAELQVKTE